LRSEAPPPTEFRSDVEAELETDSDEEGGFCFVRPEHPGAVRVDFDDIKGRTSHAHLLFTEPIEDLIHKNAQSGSSSTKFARNPGFSKTRFSPSRSNPETMLTRPEDYSGGFGVVSSLADALYLAEKK